MKRILLAVVAGSALWAAACSGGGGPTVNPPPPTGNFSNASLSGTYAFVTTGEVITSTTETPLSRTGSFVADGNGHITAGVEDVNSQGTVNAAATITGGSYTISADGRGTLNLNVVSGGFTSTITFAIVLTSINDGIMIDETVSSNQASTGSGNLIKQNTSSFASTTIVNGTYVFDFSGIDSSPAPASIIGEFAASSGAITTGMTDENDSGQLSQSTVVPASFASDPQNPGTLASSGRGLVTINGEIYAFYIVDNTRVRLISIGTTGGAVPDMLTGDAVLQSSLPPSLSGGFVFLTAGSSANGGLVRVGRFSVSGSTVSKPMMDINDAGSESGVSPSSPTISYDSATGRGTLSFQVSASSVASFVFYLNSATSGVIQEVSAPVGSNVAVAVADGSIAAQSGSPFTSSNITGPYALNWSGLVTSGGTGIQDEEDLLGQASISNLNLSGTSDIFQFTGPSLTTNIGTGGSVTFNGGNGTGDDGKRVNMTVQLSQISAINTVVYIADPQLAFFVNTNQTGAPRIFAGILRAQQ